MSISFSAVTLTSNASFVNVGSLVHLTCTVNGTPPLQVRLEDENMNRLHRNATIEMKGSNFMYQKVFSFKVLKLGPTKLRCSVTDSTGQKQSSPFVKIVGLGESSCAISTCLPLIKQLFLGRV